MGHHDLLAKVCETYRAQRAMGGEAVEHPLACLVRCPEHPLIYDANHVGGIRAQTAQEIAELFDACDGFFPAQVQHRKFFVDVYTPQPFVAHLTCEGYGLTTSLQLVLEGDLRANPPEIEIEEATCAEGWLRVAALLRLDHLDEALRDRRDPFPEEVTAGLVAVRQSMSPEMRMWIARSDASDCGFFASWPGRNGVGMVEWLFIKPERRRRGIATALIAHAVADARDRGAGPVLIGASAVGDGVPRRMYAALGFEPICVTHEFVAARVKRESTSRESDTLESASSERA